MPEASVVIPTRNRWPLLATSLELALGQEDVDVEVIVVDDGSTDETPARLAAIGDPRVRVVRHEQSRGVAAARNAGLRVVRGEWVGFCDDDDLWAPRKLRTQLDAVAESDAGFAYSNAVILNAETSVVVPDQPAPAPDELSERLLTGNALPGGCSNVVVNTEIARELGGFDERLSQVEDWDLWLRLADRTRGVRCPEVLVAYRWHGSNTTAQGNFEPMARAFAHFVAKQRAQGRRGFNAVRYSRWLASEAPTRLEAAKIHMRAGLAYRSPPDVARGFAVLAGGHGTMQAAARLRAARSHSQPSPALRAPEWLEPHRAATER